MQKVFIVGTPKSGTTFLFSPFDGHPQVLALHETAAYAFAEEGPLELADVVEKFATSSGFDPAAVHPSVSLDGLLDELRALSVGRSDRALAGRLILKAYANVVMKASGERQPSPTHIVEKTPSHFASVDEILRDFPAAKIVHVIRDPRDNYLSLKRRMTDTSSAQYQNPSYHPILFLQNRILASFEAARRNAAKYRDNYRIVVYEHLVDRGEAYVRDLAAWLGVDWHETLLVPTRSGAGWSGNSTNPALKNRMVPFDTRSVGSWRESLKWNETIVCEAIIRQYGAEKLFPLTISPSRLRLVAALALPLQHELRLETRSLRGEGKRIVPLSLAARYLLRRRNMYNTLVGEPRAAVAPASPSREHAVPRPDRSAVREHRTRRPTSSLGSLSVGVNDRDF